MLLLSNAAGIPSEELPPEMPMFSDLGSQDVDCIPPELPLNSDICHPGLPRADSMDSVSDAHSQSNTDSESG